MRPVFYAALLGGGVVVSALSACSAGESDTAPSQASEVAQEISLKLLCEVTHYNGTEVGMIPPSVNMSLEKLTVKVMVQSNIINLASFDKVTIVTSPFTNENGILGVAFSESGGSLFFSLNTEDLTASLKVNQTGQVDMVRYSCKDDQAISESDFVKSAPLPQDYPSPEVPALENSLAVNKYYKRGRPYPNIKVTATVDEVTLYGALANRGNCNVIGNWDEGIFLNFGESFEFYAECDPLEVTVNTSMGEVNVNW